MVLLLASIDKVGRVVNQMRFKPFYLHHRHVVSSLMYSVGCLFSKSLNAKAYFFAKKIAKKKGRKVDKI